MEQKHDVKSGCRYELKRHQNFLDKLSPDARRDLETIQIEVSHGANVVLFSESDDSRGLFIVLDGQVRVSIGSGDGRRLCLKIAKCGDVLGLAPVVFRERYDVTAQTLYPVKLAFIDRRDFARFLARHPEAYPAISEELTRNFNMACEQLRTLAFSATAPQKLAKLLLEWCEDDQVSGAGKVRFTLRHEDIGEFIGATRETVSRTLKSFKVSRLIAFEGSVLRIPSRAALEELAYSQ